MKIYHWTIIISLFLVSSCNIDRERKLTKNEILELQKKQNDSISVLLDSIYKVNIYVPPLYNIENVDSTTVNNFFELAKETKGELKVLVNSKLIVNEIKYIIEKNSVDNADILFLIDKTSSMEDDIVNVKRGINDIINSINKYKNVRVGIGLYGDKNSDGPNWYSFKNFESNLESVKIFIDGIKVTNGEDYPESVYDGFFKTTVEGFWKSKNKRMIILIGDAAPLEKPLSDYSMSDVIKKAKEDNITMNFYPIVLSPINMEETGAINLPKSFERSKLISSFYPNPNKGKLNINFEKTDNYEIEIFNSNGILVEKEKLNGDKLTKELYNFENGIYVIRVVDSEMKYETIKIILNK